MAKFCKERDIILTAYTPLGRPNPAEKKPAFLFDGKLKQIGDKYNKTPAQVAFRYLVGFPSLPSLDIDLWSSSLKYLFCFQQLDNGLVPIPKSVTKHRIEENIDVFDFKLTEDELKLIDTYNTGERVIHFLESRNDKHFPFAIEY